MTASDITHVCHVYQCIRNCKRSPVVIRYVNTFTAFSVLHDTKLYTSTACWAAQNHCTSFDKRSNENMPRHLHMSVCTLPCIRFIVPTWVIYKSSSGVALRCQGLTCCPCMYIRSTFEQAILKELVCKFSLPILYTIANKTLATLHPVENDEQAFIGMSEHREYCIYTL